MREGRWWSRTTRSRRRGWLDHVSVVGGSDTARLVQPDGYVAWAADRHEDSDAARGLRQSLPTWFGLPREDQPARS